MQHLFSFLCSKFYFYAFLSLGLIFSSEQVFAQNEPDSLTIETSTITNDSIQTNFQTCSIENASTLAPFFKKLKDLEDGKTHHLNILHIGDSHIQADVMTDKLRQEFQRRFGNAGLGFSFPYNLAKTNGGTHLKFLSNTNWNSLRNIYPDNGSPIGLSGIALFTQQKNAILELQVKNPNYSFSKLKIIAPDSQYVFVPSTANRTVTILNSVRPRIITHTIKSGETLSGIAHKYKTNIALLKAENGLKNSNIKAGKTLKIPTKETQTQEIEQSSFSPIPTESIPLEYGLSYRFDHLQNRLFLVPKPETSNTILNGIVLENDQTGILYHAIGVNGAKYSDYNKYDLFFCQTAALQPDLIIVSLGTNESFDKLCDQCFMEQLSLFVQKIQAINPQASILLTSAPPSLFGRKTPNIFIQLYTEKMKQNAPSLAYAFWDLYESLGSNQAIKTLISEKIIGKDRVHYTNSGYQKQGQLLFEALMEAYQNYLK